MKGAGMTREEQNRKLKAFITCLKCEVSGKPCDDNCPIQYEAGNMGEIIENLEAISKALEQEPQIFKWCKTCKEYDQEKHCPLREVEAIPKDQYEARLKADLEAILVELQLEIEEMDSGCGWEGYRPTAQVIGLIQQKINALKENTDVL